MYRHLHSLSKEILLFFALFLVFQATAQTTTPCAKYEVTSTNNICGCTPELFKPYGLFMEANNACGFEYYKPDTVSFEIRSDSTAAIRGVFRTFADWRPVRVDITLAKVVNGIPRFDQCLTGSPASVANQWRYFGNMSGTIQFDSGTVLNVTSRNGNFQVGLGANGQFADQFGGSGFFTLNNGQRGGFGFALGAATSGSCILMDSCQTDTKPPVFSNCPANINLTTTGTAAIATWTAPTAKDNCSTPSVSSNVASGTSFSVGTSTVIYTAKDAKNNTSECRFNIVVTVVNPCDNDATAPVISNCPTNITLTTTGTTAVATWTAPTATDNCTTPTLSSNYASGFAFPIGTTAVVYTAKDAKNNTSECRFNVVVSLINPCNNDATAPVVSNCPSNIALTTTGTTAIATWTAPTATDNCSIPSVSVNYTSGSAFPVGTTTVVYTIKDAKNNTAECRFNVTVTLISPCDNDAIAPVFSNCPNNITLTTLGTTATATWIAPTATDNCSTPTVSLNYPSGTAFPIGTTTVIYTARDAKNNAAECRFNITVTAINTCLNDTILPFISNCPQNITLATIGTSAIGTWTPPTATDNCGTPLMTSNFVPGASFPVGTTTVSYIAKDVKENVAECRFTVTVTQGDPCLNDATAPVIKNCPQPIFLSTAGTTAIANWIPPTATDNCSNPILTSNFQSGSAFNVGITTIIYTARDARNNSAECRFSVNVTKRIVTEGTCISYTANNTNDICGCPTRQWMPYGLLIDGANGCGEYYQADSVLFQINSDSSARLVGTFRSNTWQPIWLDIQWSKTTQKQARFSTCANDTAASRDWRFFGTAQGNIQIGTDHPLSITSRNLLQVGISANGQNRDYFGASGLVTLSDGRTGSINLVLNNPLAGNCPMACLNDSIAPRILNCPQNRTQLSSQAATVITWAAPSVRDDCSSPTLTTTHLPGASFPFGTTTVTYSARDVSGNQATCSFKVTINQVAAGSLCSSYDVSNTNDICGCSANQWKPYALRIGGGNCGDYFKSDSVVFHVNGDSTARLRGRFRSDSWVPVMVDVQFAKASGARSPRLELCQTSNPDTGQWQYFGAMSGTIKIGDAAPIAVNAGSLFQMGKGANGQNRADFGANVNFTLINGATASLNLVLTNYQQFSCTPQSPCTTDNIKPVFSNCPTDTSILTTQTSSIVNWSAPIATDNCSTPSVTSNFTSGQSFSLGSTVVIYTATDLANNTNQCRFTVTVVQSPCAVDTIAPKLKNCPDSVVVITTTTSAPASWTMPTATDNCSEPMVMSNYPSGITFQLGSTLILVTARDAAGNKSMCTFNVIVKKITGINDPNTAISFMKIAPNPAVNQLNLDWQSLFTGDAELEISNLLGQVVQKQTVNMKAGDNHLPIDVSFLAKGVYHLTLRNAQFAAPKAVRFMKI